MINKKFLFLLGCWCFLASCQQENKQIINEEVDLYFDLEKFSEEQVQRLDKLSPSVQKHLVMEGEHDNFSDDSVEWSKELSMLKDLNINKPFFEGAYEVKKEVFNHGWKETYLAKGNEKVKMMTLRYEKDQLRSLKVEAEEGNLLFTISKSFEAELDAQGNILTYSIAGDRHIKGLSKVDYDVDAVLNYSESSQK